MSSRKRRSSSTNESNTHFINMMEWLALESAAEAQRMAERRLQKKSKDAEKSGETILDLLVSDEGPGLGGRTLVTFRRRDPNASLPWHRLQVGSPVVVSEFPVTSPSSNKAGRETGVVSRQRRDSIQVALTRRPEGNGFRIDLTSDETTRQRQRAAINVAKDSKGRLGLLRSVMMGERAPGFSELPDFPDSEFVTELNESQRSAVRFALSAQDVAIIHGPPGTGKTTTVIELIVQAIARGDKVLAVAPSNTAADNLLRSLVGVGQRVVRVGHPARVDESLRQHSLDGMVDRHENMPVIKDMIREAEMIFRKSDKWTRAKRERGERQEMRGDAKRLMTDARRLERFTMETILDRADVICGTTSFSDELLGERWFDLIVIDEACQSTEPGCWPALLRGDKVVLAGDHQQLPPTVLSDEAARLGFSTSLMERVMGIYGDKLSRLLTVQYRMHKKIMDFSSQHFYSGQLVAHESVVGHLLADLETVESNELTSAPVLLLDTAGASWDEEIEPDGESKRNPQEADLVVTLVERLLDSGVAGADIAVIAPYAAQARLLRRLVNDTVRQKEEVDAKADAEGADVADRSEEVLAMAARSREQLRDVEIDTVDGFQGREKEVVIITLVRSNQKNEIGFLADTRRMNVALTRARRKLIVIGDSATLGANEFYADLFRYIESIESYHSVWEEM